MKNAYLGNGQNNGADFRVAANVGAGFRIDLVYVRDPQATYPSAVHIAPTQNLAPPGDPERGRPFIETCLNSEQWPQAFNSIAYLGNADHIINLRSDSELSACFANMNSWNMRIMVETAALKHWCTSGQECFEEQVGMWDRSAALGSALDAFSMDEPFFAARKELQVGDSYAVAETANWMKLVRERYPYSQISDIEPYQTANGGNGFTDPISLAWWIGALQERCAAIGTPMIDLFILDHDWGGLGNDWSQARTDIDYIQGAAVAIGTRYGTIFWAANKLQATADSAWYVGLMRQGTKYDQYGIVPGLYSFNDYMKIPTAIITEWVAATFMNSVPDFIINHVP